MTSDLGETFGHITEPDPDVRQAVESAVAQTHSAARIVQLVQAVGAGTAVPILDRKCVAVVMALAATPSPPPGRSSVDANQICAVAFYDASSAEWLTTFSHGSAEQLAYKIPFECVIANIDGPPVRVIVNGVALGSTLSCTGDGLALRTATPNAPPLPWDIIVATLDGTPFGSGSADGSLAKVLLVRRGGVMEQPEPGNPGPGPSLPCPTAPSPK